MRFSASLLHAIALAQLVATGTSTLFRYDNDLECSYPATVSGVGADCNGGGLCAFGDTIDVYGSLMLEENLPDYEMCIKTNVCFLGMGFACKTYYEENVNICHELGVSSQTDGTACPNAGTLYFKSSVPIPGAGEISLGSGWWFQTDIYISDCNPYKQYTIKCSASFVAESSSGYYDETSYNATIAGASVAIVAAALYFRKRRMTRLAAEQDESASVNFEMMSDGSVRA